MRPRILSSLGALTLAVTLAACGTDTNSSTEDTATAAGTTPEAEVTTTPSPEASTIETHQVGELIHSTSADFTVLTLEERDVVESSSPDFQPDFTPGEGQRLWYIDIEWTNNTNEVVGKECYGPDMFDLRVFDLEGVEMQEVDQPGFIVGQNCSTGLAKGETGTWKSAFIGYSEDFGWATFEDYGGDLTVVTLDPSLELTQE